MSAKFWVNTVLSGVMPGGYGYARTLKKYQDKNYSHERDKKSVREKHHGAGGWAMKEKDGLRYRDYSTYEEYVEHQKAKFDEIIKIAGGLGRKNVVKYRLEFFDRFKNLSHYLPPSAKIVCAGARQGTEVEVLRELGFYNAYGIDLNPGPENPYVTVGDFLHIKEPDHSVDLIYSNAVDHAFSLDEFFREHARVIKPDGYAYYDVALQQGGAFEAVDWKSDEIVFKKMLEYFKTVENVRVSSSRQWKSVLLKGFK